MEGSEQREHMPRLGIQRCPMATLEKTVCEGGQPEGAIALFQASTNGPVQWPWRWRELAAFEGGAIRTYCWVGWREGMGER